MWASGYRNLTVFDISLRYTNKQFGKRFVNYPSIVTNSFERKKNIFDYIPLKCNDMYMKSIIKILFLNIFL